MSWRHTNNFTPTAWQQYTDWQQEDLGVATLGELFGGLAGGKTGAIEHGFIRGAYHFYNPKTDASRQADFFIRSVKLESGDLFVYIETELKFINFKSRKK